MRLFAVILLIVFSTVTEASGPAVRFDRLSITEGLSQSAVASIIQDAQGFMWFGTEDGLNRFDGYEFRIYKHDPQDPNSISANHIKTLFEDDDGFLWVGTLGGGLNRYDTTTGKFTRFTYDAKDPKSLPNNSVWRVIKDSNGKIWVATEAGISRLDDDGFSHFSQQQNNPNSLSHNNVRTLYADDDGIIWVGTYGGGLNRFDSNTGAFQHFGFDDSDEQSLSNDRVLSIYRDQEQQLWIGTEGGGLNRYIGNNQFRRYVYQADNPHSLANDEIWDLQEDSNGHLWIATQGGGLNRYDRHSDHFIRYRHHSAEPTSISNDNLWSIYKGQSGIMWIGSNGGGVNKFDIKRARFGHYRHQAGVANSLSHDSAFAFLHDANGTLWVGTDKGLNRFDEKSQSFVHYLNDPNDPNTISHDWVMALFEDSNGRFWVGTLGGGLNWFDREQQRFTRIGNNKNQLGNLSDDRVSVIFEDSRNTIWVGTWSGGINRYDEVNQRFEHFKLDENDPQSLSHDSVMSIVEDEQGQLWVGTFNGLNRFDPNTGVFERFIHIEAKPDSISHNFVSTILPAGNAMLWLGTYGGGLNLFDTNKGSFKHYRENDGLANDSIYGILTDEPGHLWISTNNGLSHLDVDSGKFENYGVEDGLQSDEFNGVAYYKSPQGELFFGGIDGFNRFFAHEIEPLIEDSQLVLTDFLLFNRSVAVEHMAKFNAERYVLPKAIDRLEQIMLGHNQSLFTFEFAALEYTNPHNVRYAYRLNGFNDEWIDTSAKNRRATFTSLPPGDYRLQVKASDPAGSWSEKQLAIDIKILPPPWKSWWAYLLYILAVGSLVYIVYWVRKYYAKARLQLLANTQLKQVMQAQIMAGQGNDNEDEFSRFRLLVVDDEPQVLQQLQQILKDDKYQLRLAEDGKQALSLLQYDGPFDLVLLDVAMPTLSGYQVCQSIRRKFSASDLPVIFMTEQDQLTDMAQSFAVGANDYLSKPLAEPSLLKCIDAQLKLLEINRNLAHSNQSIKALSEICTEISSILDLSKLMDTVYIHIKELMDVDAFALGLYDEQDQTIRFHLSIEKGEFLPDYSESTSEKNRPSVWCVENRKPLIINDFEKEYADYFGDLPKPEPKEGDFTHSFMYWPLLVAGRLVGVLSIQSYRKNAYDQNQIKTVKVLASTTAIALDNAKTYYAMEMQKLAIEDTVAQRTDALQRSNKNIATLSEICTEISTTLDYNKILNTVYLRIKDLMDADIFMIGLLSEDKSQIEFKLAIKWEQILPPFLISLDNDSLAAVWCYNSRASLVINDLERDMPKPLAKLPLHDSESGREIEAFMYFPLSVHGEIIGVLTVQSYRKDAYNEHQQDMIGTIASTTAIALDNAHTYRELEQKNMQILATQKKLIQSENLASLGTLTAGIAHEINNPTNFVHVSSQNLEVDLANFKDFIFNLATDDADEEILDSFRQQFAPLFDHIVTIKEGTERIKTIVKDLRGFSYLDTDEKSQVDLAEMLHSTINLAKTKYGQLARFETDFHCQTQLSCFPAQLNQVFMNLIVNACDAIRDKHRARKSNKAGSIVVGCYCRDERIDITFRDNGCGMDEQTMEKLFLPFYTTKKVGEGTGLGLSISYSIIQKHEGELSVKSELGVGTEFRVRLPVV